MCSFFNIYINTSHSFLIYLYIWKCGRCFLLIGVIVLYIYIQKTFFARSFYIDKKAKNQPFLHKWFSFLKPEFSSILLEFIDFNIDLEYNLHQIRLDLVLNLMNMYWYRFIISFWIHNSIHVLNSTISASLFLIIVHILLQTNLEFHLMTHGYKDKYGMLQLCKLTFLFPFAYS